jgi:hypothetical protein
MMTIVNRASAMSMKIAPFMVVNKRLPYISSHFALLQRPGAPSNTASPRRDVPTTRWSRPNSLDLPRFSNVLTAPPPDVPTSTWVNEKSREWNPNPEPQVQQETS